MRDEECDLETRKKHTRCREFADCFGLYMEEDYWGMEEETEISRDEAGEQESSGTISYEITRVAKIQPDGSPSADGFEEKDIITLNERQLREYYDEVAQSASWTEDLRDLLKLPLAGRYRGVAITRFR